MLAPALPLIAAFTLFGAGDIAQWRILGICSIFQATQQTNKQFLHTECAAGCSRPVAAFLVFLGAAKLMICLELHIVGKFAELHVVGKKLRIVTRARATPAEQARRIQREQTESS